MLTFIISIGLLIVAYFTYGKFVERFFGASSAIATPVKRLADGVDYHELKPWRIFVIQFLNIAGLGPIFGAILGAAYGPMAYVWIVIGCILWVLLTIIFPVCFPSATMGQACLTLSGNTLGITCVNS